MKIMNFNTLLTAWFLAGGLLASHPAHAGCECPNGDRFEAGKRVLYKDPLPDGFVAEPIHLLRVDSCEMAYFWFYTSISLPGMKEVEDREYSTWFNRHLCQSLAQNQKSIDRELEEKREAKERERQSHPDATEASANVDLDKVDKDQRAQAKQERFNALLNGLSEDKFKEPVGSSGHQIHQNLPVNKFTDVTLREGVQGKTLPRDPATYELGHYVPMGSVADSDNPNEVLDQDTKGVKSIDIPKGRSGKIVGYGENPGTWVVKFTWVEARETGRCVIGRALLGANTRPPEVIRVAFAEVDEESFNKEIMYHSQVHGSVSNVQVQLNGETITPTDSELFHEAP